MIIIVNISNEQFSLNGINFAKIYQPLKQGLEDIGIYSIYDTRLQLHNSENFNQYEIDGVVFGTQSATITAILNVVYNPTGEGGGAIFIPSLTWVELVALAGKKNGDRFNLTDTVYAGYITLTSETTFNWINANNNTQQIIII